MLRIVRYKMYLKYTIGDQNAKKKRTKFKKWNIRFFFKYVWFLIITFWFLFPFL